MPELVDGVEQYPVRRKIALPSRALENFPVHFAVEIVIEKLLLLQPPENLVLPEQVPPQPMRLMTFLLEMTGQ